MSTTVAGAARVLGARDVDSHGRWLWRLVGPFSCIKYQPLNIGAVRNNAIISVRKRGRIP